MARPSVSNHVAVNWYMIQQVHTVEHVWIPYKDFPRATLGEKGAFLHACTLGNYKPKHTSPNHD